MQLLLRSVRRHQVVNDIDQTCNVDMGSSTPHGLRRQVVCKLGVLVGMQEECMLNQQAQDHACACALFAGLLGQLTPAFIRLPVLDTHLDEPTQRLALDKSKCPPRQVGCDEIAIGSFTRRLQGDDESFGVVGADVQPCTADDGNDLMPPTHGKRVGYTGMGGQILGNGLCALLQADGLMAASL